ncbi:glycerophosphodiester phosphodiesterase [Oleiagrimonas soli]|uniref:glycerophosphodiester phosphodiesterase n=1 Tax=Oleiagrimonas soli TaxID=1543381 RepID=A0A099CTF5_9GAMM|nr:glycerophosphodiester phosphodiesterase [Oleiagrimonas soli]KGI76956.1 glycerophosphodiester phosphodiesterase [Oleiagrimonas soli]MBB6185167.1 glycerophosphoryl diester phosphodiesterase [Oleiagrimonas soli]
MSSRDSNHASAAVRAQVYGHRGAPAHFPEHTRASYLRAIADGADFIEPDLVMTRDGVLVSRHENEIGGTTDVAEHPEFADRRTRKRIDGEDIDGWFTEDFSLAELKTLHARERLPELRGTAHDGRYPILTLDEIIELAAVESDRRGRAIGLVPEIKHGTYFRELGLPMEDRLLATLAAHDYTRKAPIEIQSFEVGNLIYLRERIGDGPHRSASHIRLLQLLGAPDRQPYDMQASGDAATYADMTTPAGLRAVALYADAIGPDADAILPRTTDNRLGAPTSLVQDAHDAGLRVHPYTFRPENRFLAREFQDGDAPNHASQEGLARQIHRFLDLGIDAFFTDDPAAGRMAVDGWNAAR